MLQVVETLPASLELALNPLRMEFGFVALAVTEQSPELAADEWASANAVEELEFAIVVGEQVLETAVVEGGSVLPFETEIALGVEWSTASGESERWGILLGKPHWCTDAARMSHSVVVERKLLSAGPV